METELALLTVTFELLAPLSRFFCCICPSQRACQADRYGHSMHYWSSKSGIHGAYKYLDGSNCLSAIMCHFPLYKWQCSFNTHWQKKVQSQHWSKGLKSWNNKYPVSCTSVIHVLSTPLNLCIWITLLLKSGIEHKILPFHSQHSKKSLTSVHKQGAWCSSKVCTQVYMT